MNLYYITGASSGIGFAMAELLLENEDNMVIGISRSCTIVHPRYKHHALDLSTPWEEVIFEKPKYAPKKVVLINNAGAIGPITPLRQHSEEDIHSVYYLNVIAPTILSRQFMLVFSDVSAECIVLNISSGAGKYPIHSWSTYCSSKAALDMLSLTADMEHPNVKFYSVAPGIVDTPMQQEIRMADKAHFPELERFIEYKENGDLSSSEEVARKYLNFLKNSHKYKEVIYSVRDF
ncbi:MAG: SDR family NAD(P)-dependent oxidoreductase [Flavobacteriales bacterium]